uniref:Olfactory receptor 13G1-like n=1 Tax=Pelodiscus sinensis TaxID=13735 RepID=K7F8N2_PELSI
SRAPEMENQSVVTTFIMVGLSSDTQLQVLLFVLFLSIYIIALLGNLLIMAAVLSSSKLQRPMYFFLFHLAVVDIICTSTIIPQMLGNLVVVRKSISYPGCMAQLYFFTWCLGVEMVLFTVMAYDRYVAVCHPLRYSIMMNKTTCMGLSALVMVIAVVNALVHTGLVLQLTFCGPNIINHFFCEIPSLLVLSCTRIMMNKTMCMGLSALVMVIAVLWESYCFIVRAILRIKTTEGRRKAFSTCSSHLIVVSLYYSAVIYTYIRPASSYSFNKDKIIATLYSLVTPTVNPIVYTLRNKDVKMAIKKMLPHLGK